MHINRSRADGQLAMHIGGIARADGQLAMHIGGIARADGQLAMHIGGIARRDGWLDARVVMQRMCISNQHRIRTRSLCIAGVEGTTRTAEPETAGTAAQPYQRSVAGAPSRRYGHDTMQGVEFHGFAGDCTIAGRVTMFGERLTDFLNGQERFHLHKVQFESLADGHVVAMDSINLERDDMLAVIGTGPRGDEKRRIRLAETRMQLSIGPYIILGRLHAAPGLDPIKSVISREPMIPLTNATMAYNVAGIVVARDVGTLIVNRFQVDWITATAEEATLFPEATVRSPFSMSLKKDFTGPSTL